MERLVRTLLLSGFGTAICGSSHPASQGEHLISHYADMLGDPSWPASFHGEQIAVTTLTMARLQERLLARFAPRVAGDETSVGDLIGLFGDALGRACWKEFAKKRLDRRRAEAINDRLASDWDSLRAGIARSARPVAELEQVLRRAGAPVAPEDIGWPRDFYDRAVSQARFIRDRYTFLDFAANVA
jgi:glycerol-1-phosphate dehydrogenase [NAD(P)+]